MDEHRAYIALATYNGASFLTEQIESIREQSHANWRLVIRDDGSEDETTSILDHYARRDPRITILSDDLGRLGPIAGYSRLLQHCRQVRANYVFLADQDDRWLPHKVGQQLQEMRRLEKAHGTHVPLLLHTDLAVVDQNLNVTHPSLMNFQRIRHESTQPLRTLLVQNFVTGCSSLLNWALLNAIGPIPPSAVMHDWWIALCAASVGRIEYLDEPTVLYRQHAGNCVGAVGYWTTLNLWRKSWHIASKASLREFVATVAQGKALREYLRHQGKESAPSRSLVEEYCAIFEHQQSTGERVRALWQLRVRRQDWVRQSLLFFRLLTTPDLDFELLYGAK